MARQTTTTIISTFLVRSLIHDFPRRSMTALAALVFPWRGHQIPSKPLLPEHRIQVLLLRANDMAFRAENLRKKAVPIARAVAGSLAPTRTYP
jgi:hypothetical protein